MRLWKLRIFAKETWKRYSTHATRLHACEILGARRREKRKKASEKQVRAHQASMRDSTSAPAAAMSHREKRKRKNKILDAWASAWPNRDKEKKMWECVIQRACITEKSESRGVNNWKVNRDTAREHALISVHRVVRRLSSLSKKDASQHSSQLANKTRGND